MRPHYLLVLFNDSLVRDVAYDVLAPGYVYPQEVTRNAIHESFMPDETECVETLREQKYFSPLTASSGKTAACLLSNAIGGEVLPWQ